MPKQSFSPLGRVEKERSWDKGQEAIQGKYRNNEAKGFICKKASKSGDGRLNQGFVCDKYTLYLITDIHYGP